MRILISFFDRRRLKTLAKLPILFCAVGFAELVLMGKRFLIDRDGGFNFKNVVSILKMFPLQLIKSFFRVRFDDTHFKLYFD